VNWKFWILEAGKVQSFGPFNLLLKKLLIERNFKEFLQFFFGVQLSVKC
jgi:hypothetical protein